MITALVLPGGGASGLVQASMIKAVDDLGLKFDMVTGTSVGSLNGALYQTGDIDRLINLWMTIATSKVCKLAPWKVFSPNPSIYDSSPLKGLINSVVTINELQRNPRKFIINATSIDTWGPISMEVHNICSQEELVEWLLSSAAVPMAFPAVQNRFDGGLIKNYPISNAIDAGATRIICLATGYPTIHAVKKFSDTFECLSSIPEYAQLSSAEDEVKAINKAKNNDIELIVVKPDKSTGISILDFDYKGLSRQSLMEYGYNLTMSALKDIA